MKPVLVGQSNLPGTDPAHALYPTPLRSSGGRLCHLVMQITPDQYLARFDRVNLCKDKWTLDEARSTSRILTAKYKIIVLLGAKVARAFDFTNVEPFYVIDVDEPVYIFLPHPSGLNRRWSTPGAYERARAVLREGGAL